MRDPNVVFPNGYRPCFLPNGITAPNITVGDRTEHNGAADSTGIERNHVRFHAPEFGDHLVIRRFCRIVSGVQFIMGPVNHRIRSAARWRQSKRRDLAGHAVFRFPGRCPARDRSHSADG